MRERVSVEHPRPPTSACSEVRNKNSHADGAVGCEGTATLHLKASEANLSSNAECLANGHPLPWGSELSVSKADNANQGGRQIPSSSLTYFIFI
jgi:hypothetical protein